MQNSVCFCKETHFTAFAPLYFSFFRSVFFLLDKAASTACISARCALTSHPEIAYNAENNAGKELCAKVLFLNNAINHGIKAERPDLTVTNSSVDTIPADADVVVCQRVLADRARKSAPQA